MPLAKNYNPQESEPALQQQWQAQGVYHFDPDCERPVYSIDTPPPTVSGKLHLGHVYSYAHADFIARFQRMNGYNVFYPMGYDDNGLPTDRLVEKLHVVTARQIGRQAFTELCLQTGEQAEGEYQALWQRLGLSVDWRHTYRTISADAQRVSQLAFIQLHRAGLVYRQAAPAIWCPECQVSIAQADLDDLERESEFVTLPFELPDGQRLPIATTRPELLAACVAIFFHPGDARYQALGGSQAQVPLYGQWVPLLPDPAADPARGTGAVMCCTFGDATDLSWVRAHHLPTLEAIDRAGRMTPLTGELAGLPVGAARRRVKELLAERSLLLERQPTRQSIRVHERCDTPVEYVQAAQWFIRVLDHKEELLRAGEQVCWHPAAMHARYRAWVENLNWDWCISRQRSFGVPFPLWYCANCGAPLPADESALPVDPLVQAPPAPCACGSKDFTPETDVLDTWATSSLSPQICGGWLADPQQYAQVFPFSLRPQSYEIIRTWAFYTLVRSQYQFQSLPWRDVLISGWVLAGEGHGKLSKSRGGGALAPLAVIEKYSADAVRYWASSTSPGKDTQISEEKYLLGTRLVTKLWNVARFAERFLSGEEHPFNLAGLSPADRWILARLNQLIERSTASFQEYEYAFARSETENFFWKDLADNYLEMAKQRLYAPDHSQHSGAVFTLRAALHTMLKLLAPFLPYVTETLFQEFFAAGEGISSIHRSAWPQSNPAWHDPAALRLGETLVAAATAVRRYKSEQNLALGSEFSRLQLIAPSPELAAGLRAAQADLMSVTRASSVEVTSNLDPQAVPLPCESDELLIGMVI